MITTEFAPSLIGAAVAITIAAGGWIVSSRSQRTDSASALVSAALAITDRHAADETECRKELAAMRADHADCTRRLTVVEQVLVAAGLAPP